MSFAIATFPLLSDLYNKKETQTFKDVLAKTTIQILFFMIPMTFGLLLLRMQIVRLILGSGHFGWEQTINTANTLGYFAVALVFTSTIPLLARAFYALHNTKIPMLATIVTVVISIIIGWLLAPKMGVMGLALAYSIGSFFNAIFLYVLLRRKVVIPELSVLWFLFKILIASLIMAVALQEIKFLMAIFVDMHRFWGVFAQTMAATIGAATIYFLLCWIFNCEEIASVKVVFARLTGRSLVQENEPGR